MDRIQLEPYNADRHREPMESLLREEPYFAEALREGVENRLESAAVAVVNGNPVGFLSVGDLEQTTAAVVYVGKAHRRKGIGTALINRVDSMLAGAEQVERAMGTCLGGDRESLQFIYRNGYYVSFSSYLMERTGPRLPRGKIEVRQYEDRDYPMWHRVTNDAFYRMREGVGILPNWYSPPDDQDRARCLEGKDDRWVLTRDGEIAAIGVIDGNELDLVAVRPDLQSHGYGRQFVSHLINEILDRGEDRVRLWVVKGNPARYLYDKLGFREIGLYHFVTRYYRPDSRPNHPPTW